MQKPSYHGLERLWNELLTQGLDRIMTFERENELESQVLEFKTAERSEGRLTPTDLQNLGRSLSAFANTDGGILIWGLKTTRGNTPAVTSSAPIKQLARFHEHLQDNLGAVITPPIQELQVQVITDSADSDCGYVALWVPASRHAPHMSIARAHNKYFWRSGARSESMPHRQVEAMILAREGPILSLDLQVSHLRDKGAGGSVLSVEAHLVNDGFGTASNLAIGLDCGEHKMRRHLILPGPNNLGGLLREMIHVSGDDGESRDVIVHRLPEHSCVFPKSSLYVLAFVIDVSTEVGTNPKWSLTNRPIRVGVFAFSSRGSCEAHINHDPGDLEQIEFTDVPHTKVRREPR